MITKNHVIIEGLIFIDRCHKSTCVSDL